MIESVCVGAIILALLIVIVYFLFLAKPFSYSKKVGKNNTTLTIEAKHDLHKVSVVARFGKEQIKFERKRIRKGQTIDFSYPSSKRKAKLIVEVEFGKAKTFEV